MAVSTLQAQVAISRYLTVKEGKMGKFMDLAAAKTKKYNSKKGQPIYYTFQVLTGPNAQQFWRVQVAPKIDDFDTADTKGNNYWQETVGNLHTTRNTQMWSFNENASHDPGGSDVNMLSRMLFYTISNTGSKGFWKFRMRVARVMKEMNSDLSMFVWNCKSGCNGNVVLVSFGHKNYADQRMDNETEYPKLVEKYNNLAREALSNGDKILSENYFQHADHFTRILNEQESYRKTRFSENKVNDKIVEEDELSEKVEEKKIESIDNVSEIKSSTEKNSA